MAAVVSRVPILAVYRFIVMDQDSIKGWTGPSGWRRISSAHALRYVVIDLHIGSRATVVLNLIARVGLANKIIVDQKARRISRVDRRHCTVCKVGAVGGCGYAPIATGFGLINPTTSGSAINKEVAIAIRGNGTVPPPIACRQRRICTEKEFNWRSNSPTSLKRELASSICPREGSTNRDNSSWPDLTRAVAPIGGVVKPRRGLGIRGAGALAAAVRSDIDVGR